MTISILSSKLLVSLQPNLIWNCSIINWSFLQKNGVTAFKVNVTAKIQNVSECLSGWYLLNHRTFCYQTWYGDPAWARVSHRIFFWHLLSSRSRSQWGLIWSKYIFFYYIIWTVDSLASKPGLMIHHQKSECLVKKVRLLYSRLRSQWRVKMSLFVQMIFSKPPNILFPNLVLWCIIMSRNVLQKDWFLIFKVKVTARAHMIKIWQVLLYLLNCWFFWYQTWCDSTLL